MKHLRVVIGRPWKVTHHTHGASFSYNPFEEAVTEGERVAVSRFVRKNDFT